MSSFNRIVQLRVPRMNGRIGTGSGTLLGDRLVLTAAHVLEGADGGGLVEHLEVLIPALGEQVAGRRVWSGLDMGLDAALVKLDTVLPALSLRRAVRWGRLTGHQPRVVASAIGFPRALRDKDQQRTPDQPSGRVNPGVGFGSRYDLEVDAPHPFAAATDPSPWSGMSGAGLVASEQDLVIGVVALDVPNFNAGRLSCVPVWRLLENPGFKAILTEHGVTTGWQSVELAGLFEPEHGHFGSPVALLRADAAVVRFRGREGTLKQLRQWCAADAGLSVALVTGPGGQGKTRLARQLHEDLRATGWMAGFSRTLSPSDPLPELADSQLPALVIVDYAETRLEEVQRLVTAAGDPEQPVRLLLLARSPGEWWSELRARWRFIFGEPLELALPALEDTLAGRQQAYTEAEQDLVGALLSLSVQSGIDWTIEAAWLPSTPDLSAVAFESVLTIQLLALTRLLNGKVAAERSDPTALEDVLLEHEQRYWQELARLRPELPRLQPVTLQRAVATATLCGAVSEKQAVATLRRVEGLRDRPEDEHLGLARWLAELYPSDEGLYWGSLQPDRVGEHLISQVTLERPAMVTEVLAGADVKQVRQALTVLTRAASAQPHLSPLVGNLVTTQFAALGSSAVEVAVQTADPAPLLDAIRSVAGSATQPEQMVTVLDALPQRSLLLGDITVEVQQRALGLIRTAFATEGDVHLLALASSVSDLASRLGYVGRRYEGLMLARESVELHQALVVIDRNLYLPDLAASVNNLAINLGEVGERDEGLIVAQQAVNLQRELVKMNRLEHRYALAGSLTNLSFDLAMSGQNPKALEAAEEAVSLIRGMSESERDARPRLLAASVGNLAVRLVGAGQPEEGLVAAQEAVGLYEDLVALNRDAYLPDFGTSLNNLANHPADVGRYEDGLETVKKAVKLRRELVLLNPDAYLPDLAVSLNNLSSRLGEMRLEDEALEAVQI